jgi:23S rRNA (guanosine2251-2'-O)-methyltransferase
MLEKKKNDKVYLYGKNALVEALTNRPDCIGKVFLSHTARQDDMLVRLIHKHKLSISELKDDDKKSKVGTDAVTQGVIATMNADKLYTTLDQVLATDGRDQGKSPSIVVLGELQDPHNVGAIIRSAAALGVHAVLLPEHNQAPITGAVVKTSAGMVFRIPIVRVGNVNDTLRKLKDKGYWVYGLDMEGQVLSTTVFDTPSVFVVGNEGNGIREKTLDLCDIKLSIPMDPRCESLNASVSAAIVLYEWSRNR